jgi:hypothetical protein
MHRTTRLALASTATAAAGIGIVVVLTGGSATRNVPAPASSVRTAAADVEPAVLRAPAKPVPARPAPARPAPAKPAPYAGQNITGYLTGYSRGAVQFRAATWVGGGLDDGHYQVGRLTHSLPLAAKPAVRSAVSICSGGQVTLDRNAAPTKSCTRGQLVAALRSGVHPYATLRVDGTGTITAVLERYVP